MKKIIFISLLQLFILIPLSNANTIDQFTPDVQYCKDFTPDNFQKTDIDKVKSCKCFYLPDLKKDINQLHNDPSIFREACQNVNIKFNCVYENNPARLITVEKVKLIDENNNCKIDTNIENCRLKLNNILQTSTPKEKQFLKAELFGCYGNQEEPQSLFDFTESDRNINSIQVFDEEKGLIANQAQKANLKNLSENTGGPVIGFINMIIEYLVGIVFVLCMGSLIYGGYNYIFAGFDSDMQEKGKNAIKYAGIGFFLIMMSYTIVILIQSLF